MWWDIIKFDLEEYISTALNSDSNSLNKKIKQNLMDSAVWHVIYDKQTGELKRFEIDKKKLAGFWENLPSNFKQEVTAQIGKNIDFMLMPKEDLDEVNWHGVVKNLAHEVDRIINDVDNWLPQLLKESGEYDQWRN